MRTSDSFNPPRDAVDRIEIASPCTVPWEAMPGNERVRFCGQCRQNVFNVEALSRDEARRLVERQEGRVCVRMLRRPDGTVVTADCWTRLRAARRRGILPFIAMLLIVGVAELVAIGSGLAGLRRLMGSPAARPPATSPQVPTPRVPPPIVPVPEQGGIKNPADELKPNSPRAPSNRKMGEVIPRAHLLGKVAYKAK